MCLFERELTSGFRSRAVRVEYGLAPLAASNDAASEVGSAFVRDAVLGADAIVAHITQPPHRSRTTVARRRAANSAAAAASYSAREAQDAKARRPSDRARGA